MSVTLKGWVFVVEDEAMISMMVEDMLVELGYGIAATASKLDQALRLAQTAAIDVAILDVNVNGQMVSRSRKRSKRASFRSCSRPATAQPACLKNTATA